jgi:group II intron reverse transcriptase/maturase
MAVRLVIGPIFEVDLPYERYGFRRGKDAKEALRGVYFDITRRGRSEVVDGDLSEYFSSIPHTPLMRCVARRITDGQVLSVIRQWLRAPVTECDKRGTTRRTTEARNTSRGAAQGSVISPLLANLYFRRFLLAWKQFGIQKRLDAHVINYADDFVICCKPGNGDAAMRAMRRLMVRLGLSVNETKTRLVILPEDSFDFLGYTIGLQYRRDGTPYVGTRPSRKAVSRLVQRIHEHTASRYYTTSVESRVAKLNPLLRGWSHYFNQGPVLPTYWYIVKYTERRLRRWLVRKHRRRGSGYRQYPDEYLYETLGLFQLPLLHTDLPSAKV